MSDIRRQERLLWAVVGLGIVLALAASATRTQGNPILAAVALSLVLVAAQRVLLAWPVMLGYVVTVILFVPIRRYEFAGGFGFHLEPYRLVVGLVLTCWGAALLADPETRFRRSGLEGPLLLVIAAILGSVVANLGTIIHMGYASGVIKSATFFLSFAGVLLFISNVISGRRAIDRTIMLLVIGGALLSLEALYEWRAHDNLFDRLDTWVPILHKDPSEVIPPLRGGMTRARASAQHPIAFGAALVMLLPLALYLYQRTRKKLWMGIAGIVVLGALVTISRTAATMLGAELITFLVLKRRETVRMLPMLLPLILCAQVAIPGTLGTFRAILFPSQGLVAEEQQGEGTGTGRLKDVPMALEQFSRKPLFGQGFGTRFTDSTEKLHNAQILDDQWLSSLLEIGAVGVAGLMWMLFRSVGRLGRRAKRLDGDDGWLMASLAASLVAFGVGMLTFDAFSFIQATFIFYILVGLAAAVLHMAEDGELRSARRAARARPAPALPAA